SCFDESTPGRSRRFVGAIYLSFLFLCFKAGFVRHDYLHSVIAETALLLAALVFISAATVRFRLAVAITAALAWLYIDSHWGRASTTSFLSNLEATYGSAWDGLGRRLSGDIKSDFYAPLVVVRDSSRIPAFPGTTDVYSFRQTHVLATSNVWNPRPA